MAVAGYCRSWKEGESVMNPFNPIGNIIPGSQLLKVKGYRRVQEYPVPPGTTVPIFDEDEDILYIKSVDPNNYATIYRYGLTELEEEPVQNGFVSEKEFQDFKEEVIDGQRSIQSVLESLQSTIAGLQSNAADVHPSSQTTIDGEYTDISESSGHGKNKGHIQNRPGRHRSGGFNKRNDGTDSTSS